ncbi:serine/threonine-protein kinase [Fibrella aestuarina]|uniref:serine/threonine-protein kinase n=1 Tax=Fibrella aestuarina TaxID=651143 RepID=UPI0003153C68|nr:serine/threonine-protein kinase [Fibrella aestuarina]
MEYRKQQFETYEAFTQQFSCDYSQPLARGGHGEIYRGVDLETNEEVAIKRRLYSPDSDLITLEKEFTHTQALPPNRFVVRYVYYGRYATPFGTFEFLVMKFYRDGNLTHNALPWHQLTEAQQRRFTEEFLKGLAHLHRHQVIHRDIKPENILLVKYIDADGAAYRPVIADFGISKLLSENPEAHTLMQNSMRVGTVTYMAPEQLRSQSLSYNADLWAFGIILYEIITGKYMIARRSFPDLQREEAYTFWRNADEQRYPADMEAIPEPYQQIIRRCLLADPTERVQSTDELLALLSIQPQLIEADKLIKAGQLAEAVEQLEAIESRASLPSVGQKLNELRLQLALAKPVEPLEPDVPIADRPVDFDDDAFDSVSLPPVEPVSVLPEQAQPRPTYPADDDDQRTQQFTEQLDPIWPTPAEKIPVSPLASFNVPEPVRVTPEPEVRSTKKGTKKTSQPAEATPVVAEVATPTPDEPFADLDVPTPDRPADFFVDEEPVAEQPEATLPDERPLTLTEPLDDVNTDTAEAAPDQADTALAQAAPATPDVAVEDVPAQRDVADPVFPPPQPPAKPPVPPREPWPVREWVGDLRDQSKGLYNRLKTQRNTRMISLAGLALILASVLIYSSGPTENNAPARQTSPVVSEDYRKALKLFKAYQVVYEKTGELNPYLWSFVHCNPDYDDSLVNSAVIRAKAMVNYTQSLFPEHEANLTGFKRQEMKHMLVSKIGWEQLPHDPNCAPGQLIENEQNK